MHIHVSFHKNRNHDDLFGRKSQDMGGALDWLTGPAMTERERSKMALADARNGSRGNGVL